MSLPSASAQPLLAQLPAVPPFCWTVYRCKQDPMKGEEPSLRMERTVALLWMKQPDGMLDVLSTAMKQAASKELTVQY